ncbi:MAG: hypothetical protein HYY23_15220 [Verrucomicrobia bacterium]|nr:hypothetical protein [Verrucomicrobiota bacterium]
MTQPSHEPSLATRLEALERRLTQAEDALVNARSASTISILIPLIDYIRKDDLPEDRKILLSLKEGEVRSLSSAQMEELVRPSRRACSAYDVLGILLQEVEERIREVFYQNWGDSIVGCFKAAERSGLLDLDRATNPNRWKNFERLAQQVETYFQAQAKIANAPKKGRH